MGLIPQFSNQSIIADIQRFAREQEGKFIEALAFIGEEFVNAAREKRTYKDRTANLRASIGYSIVKNGSVVKFDNRNEFSDQKVKELPQSGIYLLVFAGMEYALYVEAKGYDVLTGSRPSRSDVLGFFKDIL